MKMAFLQLQNISVAYQKNLMILEDLNLQIEKGTFLSLLGPSGCGKTTTLRTIAGFLTPIKGKILLRGNDYTQIPPHRRNMGVVFQNYALFPHMNVFQNVAFGLKMRKLNKNEIDQKVRKAIALVGLSGFEERPVTQLSGGQQQRVAIARAVVIEPDVLLMDEPLSNLDANLRLEMRNEIKQLQEKLGITTVYVTHDQSEAVALSDQIVVMKNGKIEQIGNPENVFANPETAFVAKFMGFQELIKGVVKQIIENFAFIITENRIIRARMITPLKLGEKVVLFSRPKKIKLVKDDGENRFSATVISKIFQGDSVAIILKIGEKRFVVEIEPSQAEQFFENQNVFLHILSEDLIALKEEDE
jgi:ABC-type Fe3+/spermidine/putrescine transport system ATPase subunit